jgi:hypothetical protein
MKAKQVLNNEKLVWMVEFPRVKGKRNRLFWPTQKEANQAIDKYERDVKKAGAWWMRLDEDDRLLIQAIVSQIMEAGQTISEVWEGFKEGKKVAAAVKTPAAYEDCVAEWKRRKQNAGKDEKYLYHAGVDLMKFGKGQERRPIHEITAKELGAWIDAQKIMKPGKDYGKPWGLSTRRTWMSLFSGLWECAIAIDAAVVNIVEKLEPVGEISRIKRLYPNETTKRLMAGALENKQTQTHLVVLALGFFGCMRPEEVSSQKPKRNGLSPEKWFGWHCIDLEKGQIEVTTDVAKTGDERIITLQPVAVEWLKLCKELQCPLPPVNEFKTNGIICELIGLEEWLRDGLRKNCATHLRAVYKNDYDVVRDLGNSIRTLLKDYADLKVPTATSLEHWMISPAVVKEYRKSREWLKVLRDAATAAAARKEQTASETAKDAS